jgi:hypothetical protein
MHKSGSAASRVASTPFRRTRSLAVPGRRMVPDAGNGSAPGVMATLARAVHHRQRTARQEYYRGDNQ